MIRAGGSLDKIDLRRVAATRRREVPVNERQTEKRASNIYEYAPANSLESCNRADNVGKNVRGKHLYRFKWPKLFRGTRERRRRRKRGRGLLRDPPYGGSESGQPCAQRAFH